MANRSYLYAADFEKNIVRDVGEWKGTIPVAHLLLLSGNPQLVDSTIWDSGKSAIAGDAEVGRQRLFSFIDLVFGYVPSEIQQELQTAKQFLLDSDLDVPSFLLEIVEIADLSGTPPREFAESLLKEIRDVADTVDRLVAAQPVNFFETSGLVYPLSEITNEEGWHRLSGFYFSRILYFHSTREQLEEMTSLVWARGEVGEPDNTVSPGPPSNSRFESTDFVNILQSDDYEVDFAYFWDTSSPYLTDSTPEVLEVDFLITPEGYKAGLHPERAVESLMQLYFRQGEAYRSTELFVMSDLATGVEYTKS